MGDLHYLHVTNWRAGTTPIFNKFHHILSFMHSLIIYSFPLILVLYWRRVFPCMKNTWISNGYDSIGQASIVYGWRLHPKPMFSQARVSSRALPTNKGQLHSQYSFSCHVEFVPIKSWQRITPQQIKEAKCASKRNSKSINENKLPSISSKER